MSTDYDDYNYDYGAEYEYGDGDETSNTFPRQGSAQFVTHASPKIMYKSLSEYQTVQRVLELAKEVGSQIGYEHALAECVALLMKCNFDVYKATQLPFETPDATKTIANGDNNSEHYLVEWSDRRRGHLITNIDECECDTCFIPLAVGEGKTFCKHFMCSECWQMKLNAHRTEWGQSKLIFRCEDIKKPSCLGMTLIAIIESELRPFVGADFSEDFFPKHQSQWCKILPEASRYTGKTSIKYCTIEGKRESKDFCHSRFVMCGTDNCNHIFEVERDVYKSSQAESIVGKCNECTKRTCFLCHCKEHSPASCATMSMWQEKESDEGLNAQWVLVHTKKCPQCQSMIEKNEGCNHMTCRKCKHEFCWICMGNWSEHGNSFYKCNKPIVDSKESAKTKANIELARASLNRYSHYYDRYRNHMNSVKLDEKTMEAVKRYVNSNFGGENVSYLEDVAHTLFECRYTLANTYIYAYFEVSNLEIFEFNQGRLEHATEELSRIVETCRRGGELQKTQEEIHNKADVAKRYLEILRKGI